MEQRRVRDIYHKGVIFCQPSTPLQEVVRVMADTDIHAIIVTEGDQDTARAVVSHRDVIAHYGQDLTKVAAGEVMKPNVITVSENTPVVQASKLLLEKEVDRLLVTDEEGNTPLGILSTTDVIRDMSGSKRVWRIG
jgi:CBS domain-containing protein